MEMQKRSASSGKAGTGAPVAESKLALHVESGHAGVDGAAAQLLLDAQQLVVLCHTLGAVGAPVLIWQVFRATARSAMVVSSVSPER